MTDPIRAMNSPIAIDVVEGKNYFWCACGRSAKQPFCDGSHSGTDIQPFKYQATATKRLFFCGCKSTKRQPLCDGSHNKS